MGFLSARGQYHNTPPGHSYFELGVGVSVYNNPHVQNISSSQLPMLFYGEVGRFKGIFSLAGGYDFRTSYLINSNQLRTNFAFLYLKADFFNRSIRGSELRVYGLIGPTYHHSSLLFSSSSQVVIEECEMANSTGLISGIGAGLYRGRWTFSAKALLLRSGNNFLGGAFEKSRYQTGSERVQLTIGLRIIDNLINESDCETYY